MVMQKLKLNFYQKSFNSLLSLMKVASVGRHY